MEQSKETAGDRELGIIYSKIESSKAKQTREKWTLHIKQDRHKWRTKSSTKAHPESLNPQATLNQPGLNFTRIEKHITAPIDRKLLYSTLLQLSKEEAPQFVQYYQHFANEI